MEYIVVETAKARCHVSIFPMQTKPRLIAAAWYGYSPKKQGSDDHAEPGTPETPELVWKDYLEGTDAQTLFDACVTEIRQRFGPIRRVRASGAFRRTHQMM